MEEIRPYRIEEEPDPRDDERLPDVEAAALEEEVPFHIPRD
jgi:hypothetical protein